jgi:dienelactone hydrolase
MSLALTGLAACDTEIPKDTSTSDKDIPHYQKWADPNLDTLADLSIEALRNRSYGSVIKLESRLDSANDETGYQQFFSADGSPTYNTYMASYQSDGNRVYSRMDIPASPPPQDGYPVLVLVHGWVGLKDAPVFDFGYKSDSLYSRYIDAFVDAGYLVLTPGWRGHGTVNGIQAEGSEFMETWDNGSYISPIFYAVDILNLIEGIQSIENIDWTNRGTQTTETPRVNQRKIHVSGHSQGGDSALTVMAVSGENSSLKNAVYSGSLWSGCFGTRFAQAGIYGPMASTLEAFMSGDGSWTGSAMGQNGSINPNFVFAWPPDWIGTLDTNSADWGWQTDNWNLNTVAESLEKKFSEMYNAVNEHVENIDDASFKMEQDNTGKATVRHDPRIIEAMHKISAFNYEQYLTEPLLFHHSDQDYYSIPEWNADLSARINNSGGNSHDFTYPGNTHSLLISKHEWFSKKGTKEGFATMVLRDLNLLEHSNTVPAPNQ